MRSILDRLVVGAGLNVWRPSFAGKRTYGVMRSRLLEAAAAIRFPMDPSKTLAERLYMPPHFDPSLREDIELDWELFLDGCRPAGGVARPGVVLGIARAVLSKPGWKAPALQLADSPTYFWLDRARDLLPAGTLPPEHRWLVAMRIEVPETSTKPRVEDAWAMLLSRHWIPCYSGAHVGVAESLVAAGHSFEASIASDEATAWALPDFIVQLQNTRRRVGPDRPLPDPSLSTQPGTSAPAGSAPLSVS